MQDNVERVWTRIRAVLSGSGREMDSITLVAVTKNVPADRILEARQAGIVHFGENKVQEAKGKIPLLPGDTTWHMVGHLQRNKAKDALALFDLIQSLDSMGLADELSKRARSLGTVAKVLIQVNTSGEETKSGVRPDGFRKLLDYIGGLEGINVTGLMTIGPFTGDAERIRSSFRMLRELFDTTAAGPHRNVRLEHLSMGMTDDFEIALEEGANMLRIGRAIFGERTISQGESAR
jgi:pyridoxal phosphate enzyme (YggS family)